MITWKEFKDAVERQGLKDEDRPASIDWDNDPDQLGEAEPVVLRMNSGAIRIL
jgi:hypothetical protein